MKPELSEWVAKAEGDFVTARREISAIEYPNYDAVCFHAQQCVEKYLKARLVAAGRPFPKIHDLSALLNLVLPLEPSWVSLREEPDGLTNLGGGSQISRHDCGSGGCRRVGSHCGKSSLGYSCILGS